MLLLYVNPSMTRGEAHRPLWKIGSGAGACARGRRSVPSAADDLQHPRPDALGRDAEAGQRQGGLPFWRREESQEDVLGAHVVMVQGVGFLLGENDGLASLVAEAGKEGCGWALARPGVEGAAQQVERSVRAR